MLKAGSENSKTSGAEDLDYALVKMMTTLNPIKQAQDEVLSSALQN